MVPGIRDRLSPAFVGAGRETGARVEELERRHLASFSSNFHLELVGGQSGDRRSGAIDDLGVDEYELDTGFQRLLGILRDDGG